MGLYDHWVDLSGVWRAKTADPELEKAGTDREFADEDWEQVNVPSHWGQHDTWAEFSGTLIYRKRFATKELPHRRLWLTLDGIVGSSEVWLDGRYLGATEAYFSPHRFDITDLCAKRNDHTLAITVTADSPDETGFLGSLTSGPLAPAGNPGGIYKRVHITDTGPVAIAHGRLICVRANSDRATVRVRLILDANNPLRLQATTTVTDGTSREVVATVSEVTSIGSGESRLEWDVDIDNPDLWFPAGMGDQPTYTVMVTLTADDTNGVELSDKVQWDTGLRSLDFNGLATQINEKPVYIKAISLGPKQRFGALATNLELSEDVSAAYSAGFNTMRIDGHIADDAVYKAADEFGMLLIQDMPMPNVFAGTQIKLAKQITRKAIDHLAHHPSIIWWCPRNNRSTDRRPHHSNSNALRKGLTRALSYSPSWSKNILDPTLRRECQADPSRQVVLNQSELSRLVTSVPTETKLGLGWHSGEPNELCKVARRWPNSVEFISDIGSQSVIMADWEADEPTWASADQSNFARRLPRHSYSDGLKWALATQQYQAHLIKSQIEQLRLLQGNPNIGYHVLSLNDGEQEGGYGLRTYNCDRKLTWEYVKIANSDVLPICTFEKTKTGQCLIKTYVANSTQTQISGRLMCSITTKDNDIKRCWAGTAAANQPTAVAEFVTDWPAPDTIVNLELTAKNDKYSNHYKFE